MKILQVAPYFSPFIGGQEKYIHNLSKYLVKNGHEVDLITSNYPLTTEYEKIDGINIRRTKVLMKPLRNPISYGFLKINKIVDNYDIVHIHNEYSFPSMTTTYFKNKKNFPLILTNHITQLNFENHLKNSFGNIYNKTVGKAIRNRCDAIITLSKSHKELQISISPKIADKIKIIPNAIDLEHLKELDNAIDKNYENGSFKLLYVGQLLKRKGIQWLIKAVSILKENGNKIKLDIVGDGEDKNYFKKMVTDLKMEDIIEFKGNIHDEYELVSLYKNSDVLVLPSLSEGLPTVILEALYFGLPVIASNIPGIRGRI